MFLIYQAVVFSGNDSGIAQMKNEPMSVNNIEVLAGYRPGLIGDITKLHAEYYFENWGFHINFETQVATELSQFCLRFDPASDGLWASYIDRRFVGSIAIDGSLRETEGFRLRWFIVPPEFQGTGIGATLLDKAVDFCSRHGFPRVFLWTFKGLDAARFLYERVGFVLTEEHSFSGWGAEIVEQKFTLDLNK